MPIPNSGQISLNDDINDTLKADTNETDVSLGDNNTLKFAAVADGDTISGRSMSELRGQSLFQIQPDTEENGALGQSLHLDYPSSNHNYLSVVEPGTTSAVAYTRKKGTFSFWVKFHNDKFTTSDGTFIYSAGSSSTSRVGISVYSGSLYVFLDSGFYHRTNNNMILDQNGWYNIVVSIDTTKEDMGQSRCQAYINGIEVFWDQNFVDVTENFNLNFGTKQRINQYHATPAYSYGDITYADCKYIDGLALKPTAFGELSEGIWIPKAYAKPSTDAIHTSNLQVHYKFEGNFEDSTSNNKDGTGINNVTIKQISGGSADFNGTNSRMSTGYTFSGAQRTITMWIYANVENNDRQYIFGDYSSGGTDSSMSIACQINTSGQLYIFTGAGGVAQTGLDLIDFKPHFEKWTHLAFVYNGTSVTLYIDNQKYELGNTPSSPQNGLGPLGLGIYNPTATTTDEFQGFMGEVQIYNTNLTDAQVEKNYNANKHLYAYGPYGWHLPLNNDDQGSIVDDDLVVHLDASDTSSYSGSGSTWSDLTSNDVDFTINGASFVSDSGNSGGYFDFDGSNDDAESAANSALNFSTDNEITVELWSWMDVKHTGFLISDYNATSGQNADYNFAFRYNSGGNAWQYYVGDQWGSRLDYSESSPSLNQWVHWTLTYSKTDGEQALYKNGHKVASKSATLNMRNHDHEFVLANYGISHDSSWWNGRIAQVRVYDKALTAQQVVQNYRATQGSYNQLSIVDKGPNAKRVMTGGSALTAAAHVKSEPTNNFATLNAFKSTYMTVSEGGLKPISSSSWSTAYSEMAVTTGKWYYEVKITQANTITAASKNTANGSYLYWGVHDTELLRSPVGEADILVAGDSKAFIITDTGSAGTNSSTTSPHYGTTHINSNNHWAVGDVIGLALNADTGVIQVYKNGSTLGSSVTLTADSYTPFAIDYPGHGIGLFNFGQKEFEYAAPSGYQAWSTSNLTIGDINPEDKENPSDFFDILVYNGNGEAGGQTIGGLNFTPDLVMLKGRENENNRWQVIDSLRGDNRHLDAADNIAETKYQYGYFITDDGIRTESNYTYNNGAAERYVVYCFKGGGAPSAATPYMVDGTGYATATAASLSAGTDDAVRSCINTDAGISIVQTGTYSSTARTYSHGLGVKPELVIAKSINDSQRWYVWYDGFNQNEYLSLNQNTAKSTINGLWGSDATPHSSTLVDWHGTSGHEYIIYSLVSVPGFSKIGSYEGNGNANGPFIYTGFKPKFIMIKALDQAGDWMVFDTTRNDTNDLNARLDFNEYTGEVTDSVFEISSNGFKLITSSAAKNASTNNTYLYWAIAEDSAIYNQATASAQTNIQKFLEKGTGKSELPEEHFKTVLWTGTGADKFIETGFKPGFIWSKKRGNDTKHHRFQDIVRGPGIEVFSPSNQAEFDGSGTRTKSFDEKGFTIGSDASLNDNGDTFVGWVWRGGDSTVTKKPTYTDSGILSSNLALHYNFADSDTYGGTGTTVSDLTTNNNDGVLGNSPTWKTNAYGNYFDFDGSNDTLTVEDSTDEDFNFANLNFTMEYWVNLDSVSVEQPIASKRNTGNPGLRSWILYNNPSNNLQFILYNDGDLASETIEAVSALTANTWHHVVVKGDGTSCFIYVNGVKVKEQVFTTTAINDAGADLQIGYRGKNSGYNYFNGKIGQVRMYSSGLTEAQIRANYNATRTLYQGVGTTADVLQTNLELNYDFDDTDTYDTSWGGDNKVASFNGASSRIVVPKITGITADVTYSTWAKINSTSTSNRLRIVEINQDDTNGYAGPLMIMYRPSDGQFLLRAGNGTSSHSDVLTHTYSLTANQWYHIAATRDDSTNVTKLYINGQEIDSETVSVSASYPSDAETFIGDISYSASLDYNWNGEFDQVRIFNKPLSASEIKTLYSETQSQNSTLQILGDTSCVAAYNFNGNADDLSNNYDGTASNVTYSGNSDITKYRATDKTSNNNDGTIIGATLGKSRVGKYFNFNGSSQYINIPDDADLRAKVGMTAEVWFKADSVPSSGGEGIFSKKISTGGQEDWVLGFWTNTYQWAVDSSKSTSGGTVQTGVWTHLVGTYDGVSLNIYENGKLIKTAAASGTPTTSTSAVSIGRWYSNIANNYMFDGQVAQARFYKQALSKAEVKANYDATKAQFHSPLIHSEISLNDKAGFSIAKWTGTGISDNIATGLSNDVDFAMVKRTDAAGDWFVWHKDVTKGNDKYLYLNYANAVSGPASTSVWNGGQFENKVINLGTNTQINTADGEYIAYAWREIPGYCKIGTWVGDGGTNHVEMGFRPRFIMAKSYIQPSNYNWIIVDFERGMGPSEYSEEFTGTARVLYPNLSNVESYFSSAIDQTATGIKFGGTSWNHSSSYKWVYIAFA
jgi:hypothetical protein